MLAVRAELKAGQQIILQRLMEANCARPFLRAGNTEVVRQDGQGSPSAAVAAQPMSALKGATAADRDPEEKTNNVEAADALELEAAKRKLDFEDQAEEVRTPKFKGAPLPDEPDSTETPSAEEGEDVTETPEDAADEANLQAKGDAQEEIPSELRVRNCSVKLDNIDKLLPPGLVEKVTKRMMEKSSENVKLDEILASHPEIRKCTVELKDLRHHPWYGSKISGMTPCESSTMEVQDEIKEEEFDDPDEEMMAVLGHAHTGGEKEDPHTDSDQEMLDTLNAHGVGHAQIRADEDARSDSDGEVPVAAKEIAQVLDSHEREKVLDLSQMKKCVDNGEYTRVLSFHLAFKQVLATVHVPGPGKYLARNAIKKVYKSAMALAFPWFDVSNPAANYEANSVEERMVRPPNSDHVYADRKLTSRADEKMDEQNEISEQVPTWKKYKKRNRAILAKDTRKCLFCHQQGDADRSRLIYFRQNGELMNHLRPGDSHVVKDRMQSIKEKETNFKFHFASAVVK